MKLSMQELLERRWFAMVMILLAGVLTAAMIVASHAGLGWIKPLVTVDGTYQTFAMLNRLSGGALPGQDFVPYLGVLLCYGLSPAFWLFGQSVFGAFAAAQLMVQFAWFATCVALLWGSGFSRRNALVLGAVVYMALFVVSFAGGFLTDAYRAGQSLMFLRDSAALPVVLAMVMVSTARLRRGIIAAGVGVMLFWSPSAGVALFCTGMAVIAAGLMTECGLRKSIPPFLGLAGIAILSALLTATIISGGYPLWLINKVFLGAGQTQFWFFGGFSGDDRLLRISDAVEMIAPTWREGLLLTALLTACAVACWRSGIGSRRCDAIALICGSQLVSGLASQAAGHLEFRYLHSFAASALVVLIGLLLPFALKLRISSRVAMISVGLVGVVAVVALPVIAVTERGNKLYAKLSAQLNSGSKVQLSEAGMAFPVSVMGEVEFLRRLRSNFDSAGVPADRRMISAYYSWSDITLGAAQSPRFSSIIQLMTDNDRAYFANHLKDRAPELVSTLDPAASTWALWNLRASWSFYRAALATHDPKWRGSSMVYWARRPNPITAQTTNLPSCTIKQASADTVELSFQGGATGGAPVLLDIALTYSALPGRAGLNGDLGRGYLRVADRSPILLSSIVDLANRGATVPDSLDAAPGLFYGLPSGQRQSSIPVEYRDGQIALIRLDVQGGNSATLKVDTCKVTSALPNPLAQLDRLARLTPVVRQ